ncbi:hypothetical protein [Amycolatopsis thermophila]|uniref:Gas vesicle protein K n=1 Tax=Amycolatopsis thermophila TaxID=206084 RepID=A0ABU0EMF8_9PSEU|nr:hypothetical protein [Amycolatopsis thermophila]MDQ0376469.1 hypothetical protein [Amycolatopsis thermophila]
MDDVAVEEFRLLAMLRTMADGMGHVLDRLQRHQEAHGTFPPAELREMSNLLREVAAELDVHADRVDPPIMIEGLGPRPDRRP